MAPPWLTALAWIALVAAFACAAEILYDILGRGYRQHMRVMEWVWPITALYFGPVAVWAYRKIGRPKSMPWQQEHGENQPRQPQWGSIFSGVSHCGAGCTLGDIIAETAIFLIGIEIAGVSLWPEYIGDYALALSLGIVFQYFAIAPMRGLGLRKGIVQAAKADVLSLTAFEVGLFAWMALMRFAFFPDHPLHPNTAAYWFLMQVGMVLGFLTAWPANVWLIKRGIKEAMEAWLRRDPRPGRRTTSAFTHENFTAMADASSHEASHLPARPPAPPVTVPGTGGREGSRACEAGSQSPTRRPFPLGRLPRRTRNHLKC